MEPRGEQMAGAFLLRFSLGMLFFFAGVGKFMMGLTTAREAIVKSGGWLPVWSVQLFGAVLPFAEVGLGLLLMLGLFRVAALVLGSLLMVTLVFGTMINKQHETVASNMMYVAMFAAALFTTRWDLIAVDTLLFRRKQPTTNY